MRVCHGFTADFDDPNLVSCAGLAPLLQLAERAGLQRLVGEHVELGKPGGVNAHLKIPSLVAGMIAGADSIDDMALLRHGAMGKLFTGVRGAVHARDVPAQLHPTSIDPGAIKGDLAERLLPIELERITTSRLPEEDILQEFQASLPQVLGAVLDLVVVALNQMPQVDAPAAGWPRMADFATVLAALDQAGGTDALATYIQVTRDTQADVAVGDPLADRVLDLFAETPGWRGTPSQLLSALNVDDNVECRKGYKSARELSSNLRRLVPALRTLGVEVTLGKSGSQRWIRLDRVTPE